MSLQLISLMATITSSTTFLSSSTAQRRSTISAFVLCPQAPKFRLSTSITQPGFGLLSPWNGLRHLGISIKQKSVKIEKKERCRGKVVYASLFGVGAPEALVIGVVALLVFGPKGLAEVARNLGKTLRAFQPTIRELQEVSRDFKSTLEREIGLDDIPPSTPTSRSSTTTETPTSSSNNENSQATPDSNGASLTNRPYSSEEYLKTTEEQLEAIAAQQQTPPQQSENQPQVQDGAPPTTKPFNIGEFLVEAQIKSTAAQLQEQTAAQEQTVPQEAQSESQPQSIEVAPTMSPSNKPESEL